MSAIMVKISGNVVGIGRTFIMRAVAIVARRGGSRELSVGVALGAIYRGMRTGQRESGGVVVKRRGPPGVETGMASRAFVTEMSGHMIRIRGSGIVGCVAREAGRGGHGVVEGRPGPSRRRNRVALLAVRRQAARDVARSRRMFIRR